ncbi:malectin domain-containing carbohydrate-binding protein [Luteococcus sp.]|uniref:malectin domain-containing carbohydrate-binding protein n=1 Tax=Luteococcus sp. TaxID=1969402 RepID=UPI003736523F
MQSLARRALGVTTATVCSPLLLALTPACGTEAFSFYSIAANHDVTDRAGRVWRSHAGLEGGRGVSTTLEGKTIRDAYISEVFTANVWGEQTYRIPVPAEGTYAVTLYAAEDFFKKKGQRVFHIDAEGSRAASNIDIFEAVGFGGAYRHGFMVKVTDGMLDLDFGGDVNYPLVSALKVERAAGDETTDTEKHRVITPAPTTSPNATPSAKPSAPASTAAPTANPTAKSPLPDPAPAAKEADVAAAGAPTQAPAAVNPSDYAVSFTKDSFWFEDISKAPLAGNSQAQAADLTKQVSDWYGGIAAFNAHQYNVALETVDANQPKKDIKWVDCQGKGSLPAHVYDGLSYFKGVPIPDAAAPAMGTDGQLSIYQPSTDKLWEFWQAKKTNSGWEACWGGRIDDVSKNKGMFRESYGVSATNIALAGGMITFEDVRRGKINHALSLAIINPAPHNQISWPAQRSDGSMQSKGLIREGQRLRLDPNLDLSKYNLTPMGRMVAEAAQTYGFIITDKAGAVAIPTESGYGIEAKTGKNPWDEILAGTPDYLVLKNFPWDKTQFLPVDHGKP